MPTNKDSEKKSGIDKEDNTEDDNDDAVESDEDEILDFQNDSFEAKIPPMDNIIDTMMNIISDEKFDLEKMKKSGPYVWGFSLTVSPDRKPIIRKFGNIKTDDHNVSIQEEREPLIDILEEDNELVILVELPGVTEEQISLDCADTSCKLIVNGTPKYQKIIDFPAAVDPISKIMQYQNGILEIKFKKI